VIISLPLWSFSIKTKFKVNRYALISIASAIFINGCSFGPKPWKTEWQESPIRYYTSGVQISDTDKQFTLIDNKPPSANNTQLAPTAHQPAKSDLEQKNENRYPIDLPTVLRLAGANHLDIALFREKVHEAYANALVAVEGFIPTLNPGISFARREGMQQRSTGEFIDADAQQTFIGGNITLDWELGEAIYSTLAEMQRYHASNAELEATVHDAVLEAALAYIELTKAQARVVISEQAVEISEKLVRQTESAVLQGMGFKGDVLRAKAQLSSNKLALTEAKESFKIASIRLATILRLDAGIELYPVEKVVVPIKLVSDTEKLPELVMKAMMQRPELKGAEAILRAVKDEHSETVWGSLIPSLRAETGAGGLGTVLSDLSSREDYRFSLGWRVGPNGIFDIGRQHLTRSKYETQRIRLAKLSQEIEEEVRVAYTQVQAKAEQMRIAKEGVIDATESLKLNQERQKMGIGIPLEVLQAEEAITRIRLDHLSAITEYNKSQYILFTKIGMNPMNGIYKSTGN